MSDTNNPYWPYEIVEPEQHEQLDWSAWIDLGGSE